jgi:hypothetical protein
LNLRTFSVVLLFSLARASSARATPSSKLTYARGQGAEPCPDEATLRSAVSERLGYDPFFPWAKRTVVIEIDQTSSGAFVGRLRFLTEDGALIGERKLGPKTLCPELVQTLALATAIALDELEAAPSPAPPPEPATPVTPGPLPPPVPRETPSPAESSERPAPMRQAVRRWTAALSLLGSVGAEPSLAFGGRAAFGLRVSWFSVAIEAQGSLPASTATSLGGRVRDALEEGSLVSCAHWGVASGCLLASAGALLVDTLDVTSPKSGSPWFASAGARVGVEIGLGARMFALADVTAMITMTPVTVQLNGQSVYTTSPVSGTGAVGVGVRF